eukprot:13833-Pleurochrysis_carterae.AAC.2
MQPHSACAWCAPLCCDAERMCARANTSAVRVRRATDESIRVTTAPQICEHAQQRSVGQDRGGRERTQPHPTPLSKLSLKSWAWQTRRSVGSSEKAKNDSTRRSRTHRRKEAAPVKRDEEVRRGDLRPKLVHAASQVLRCLWAHGSTSEYKHVQAQLARKRKCLHVYEEKST